MQLTIYHYCQERQRDRNESPIRVAWSDAPPERGQLIGMEQERRWQVAEVYTFSPSAEVPITAVHLAMIELPDDATDQADWDCWRYRHLVPNENIYVHLEEAGLPELGIGFNCLNEPPTVGQQLFDAVPTGEGTKLRPIQRPWQIERYDSYTPADEGCPYTAVYLNWCQALSREPVAA